MSWHDSFIHDSWCRLSRRANTVSQYVTTHSYMSWHEIFIHDVACLIRLWPRLSRRTSKVFDVRHDLLIHDVTWHIPIWRDIIHDRLSRRASKVSDVRHHSFIHVVAWHLHTWRKMKHDTACLGGQASVWCTSRLIVTWRDMTQLHMTWLDSFLHHTASLDVQTTCLMCVIDTWRDTTQLHLFCHDSFITPPL